MIKRCIMIFPKFENGGIIDEIRDKYDPLAKHVAPHVTLVFPFGSEISTEQLTKHLTSVLSEYKPFEIILKELVPSETFGHYLFLSIQEGGEEIIKIHKALYTGILESYFPEWLQGEVFMPHMTVGSFTSSKELKKAVEETSTVKESFKTIVEKVSVEIIDENEDSIIELTVPLKKSKAE